MDAVNMSQLSGVQSQLQSQISQTQRIACSGVALASAMSAIPQSMTPGESLIAAGAGHCAGQSAMAVGISHRTADGKWVYKANVGLSSTKFNVGVGYQFH